LPSPPLYGDSGAGKIGHKNSPGNQHIEQPDQAGGYTGDMRSLQFITAIPWSVGQGSGCYVGTRTLAEALCRSGIQVDVIRPGIITPVYSATRLLFNESLRWRRFRSAATIGIDADGYAIPRRRNSPPHIACIKGVLGDAVRFEAGATRISLALQASLERRHARRADLVITVSRYCAERLEELYGIPNAIVVPELIDLDAWRRLFRANPVRANPAAGDSNKFTILSVCRFYPRKRLDILLRAAGLLRKTIPELEVRIVGNGPEHGRLQGICRELHLAPVVRWLGDASLSTLAEEYNRCDVFCLPSVQEGFGIVFLEAMAAGKPIVAARVAAIPEVVRNGLLVEADNPEALAEAIRRLYRDPQLRRSLGSAGLRDVEQFEMNRVAARFLAEIARVAPVFRIQDLRSEEEEKEYK
jgi:glycosyltransferase involved in cell wall biosynthesis